MQAPQVTLTRTPVDPATEQGETDSPSHAYTARIGAEVFPVDDFAVQQVDGRVILNLVFEVGSLQVPEPSASTTTQALTPPPPKPDDNRRGVWGKPGPDPRESLPGWTPEVAE